MFKFFKNNISIVLDDDYEGAPYLTIKLYKNKKFISKIDCVINNDNNSILIGDIIHHKEHRDYSKGYGTKMIEKLLTYATEKNFNFIEGNLSIVDLKHKDRLKAFYTKNGFEIIEFKENDGMYWGKVIRELNKNV